MKKRVGKYPKDGADGLHRYQVLLTRDDEKLAHKLAKESYGVKELSLGLREAMRIVKKVI
jgi:hypothetical protein